MFLFEAVVTHTFLEIQFIKMRVTMNVNDLRGKKIAFAASGGLDSCTITHWLACQGVEVVCFTADLGQPDETDFEEIGKRMREAGASNFIAVDLKNEMAEMGLSVVQSNARWKRKTCRFEKHTGSLDCSRKN